MDHNEILKHVKALYEYNQTSDKLKNELAIAFPELLESEDAKIRKEFCKDIWTFIPNEKAHKYIAWLEKQGNQREELINKACDVLVDCIEDYMLRRMEVWSEECKNQTLENIRKKLEE